MILKHVFCFRNKLLRINITSDFRHHRYYSSSSTKNLSHEYQKTLNLPNSGQFGLSMKNICKTEQKIKKLANFDSLYKWQIENKKDKPIFTLHDGPPYANGDIHIGHMVNKVLKDIVLRYKLLAGYQVNYIPGWDCHGLPIELNAVKNLTSKEKKKKSSETTTFVKKNPIDIRRYANEYAQECINTQMSSFKELNLLVNWADVYRTIDVDFMCKELDLFYDLYEKKLIYRDYMPVYWSVSSQTALAEFELEYKENHQSESLYVRYEIDNFPELIKSLLKKKKLKKLYALIWTTTPWSLPCNKAIAFNPAFKYSIVSDNNDDVYLISTALVETIRQSLPLFDKAKVWDIELNGDSLLGSSYINPFNRDTHPMLPSDHVSSKTGTGLVHIAPALGHDDFKLAIKHNLATECVVNEQGKYNGHDGILKKHNLIGESVLDPRTGQKIKEILGDSVIHAHIYTHSYPYDWRTKKPCIIRSSMQWFIDTNKLKEQSLSELKKVKIRPSNVTTSMNSTLASRPYWCISRQRSWGLPIPCFYDKKQDKTHQLVSKELIECLKSLIKEEKSIDFWWTDKYYDKLVGTLNLNGTEEIAKSYDIFDIWFDSGSSFNCVLGNSKEADLYCEGIDQFSGWFQSSLLLSVALKQKAPYKNLLVHGFVVDENNHKMSKSIGNVINPRQAIYGVQNKLPECGLDTLRFWISHEYHKSHIQIGKNVLEKFLNRTFEIRSILRFITSNLNDMNPDNLKLLDYESLLPLDKILLNQLDIVIKQVAANYDDLNLNKSILQIENFFLTHLSSLYINSVRDRLYCERIDSVKRRSAQTTLYHAFCKSLVMLAPIMPHLSEEAFSYSILNRISNRPDDYSLFRSNLIFSSDSKWDNSEINKISTILTKLRGVFYEEIQSEKIGLFEVNIECCNNLYNLLKTADSSLEEIFGCSTIEYNKCDMNSFSREENMKTIEIGEQIYFFRLEAKKNLGLSSCLRCRRFVSSQQNQLCSRCYDIIKN